MTLRCIIGLVSFNRERERERERDRERERERPLQAACKQETRGLVFFPSFLFFQESWSCASFEAHCLHDFHAVDVMSIYQRHFFSLYEFLP